MTGVACVNWDFCELGFNDWCSMCELGFLCVRFQ